MPKRRLPPLHALRGFEAAGRHLSFTLAAEEIHVTQGAVSRQIRDLEEFLGRPLFRRFTRRIELTSDGEEFFRVVQAAFEELERGTRRFDRSGGGRILTVSILPTIASFWLMPRLDSFTRAHPGVEVRIISSIEPANLLAHDADVAVRVGKLPGRRYDRDRPRTDLEMVANWNGVTADELFPDVLVPVCSPRLLGTNVAPTPQELVGYPLIHTLTRRHAWADWLRVHGVRTLPPPEPELEFGHFFMALEAARKGLGIAIVPEVVFTSYEGRGDLMPLTESAVPSAGEYYLLVHESRLGDPHVLAFRNWMIEQARQTARLTPAQLAPARLPAGED